MEQKLSEHNVQELNKFLRHFQNKKITYQKNLDLDLEDFISDNLTDDTTIFNKSDIERMFQDYTNQVKQNFDKDMSTISRMAGVYVKFFMMEAQKSDVQLEANLNILEDIRLLEQMRAIENGEGYQQEKQQVLTQTNIFAKKVASKLPGLLGGGGEQDDKQKIKELEEKLAKCSTGGSNDELLSQIEDLKQKVSDMEQEYAGVKTDLDKKLNESVQVTNLKKMLQQKNQQVKELKIQLEQQKKQQQQ